MTQPALTQQIIEQEGKRYVVMPNGGLALACTAHANRFDRPEIGPGPCTEAAMTRYGVTVCWTHGGASVAKRALAHALPDATERLIEIIREGKDADALRAIENVFDRGGVPRGSEHVVEHVRAELTERLERLRADVVEGEVLEDDGGSSGSNTGPDSGEPDIADTPPAITDSNHEPDTDH